MQVGQPHLLTRVMAEISTTRAANVTSKGVVVQMITVLTPTPVCACMFIVYK